MSALKSSGRKETLKNESCHDAHDSKEKCAFDEYVSRVKLRTQFLRLRHANFPVSESLVTIETGMTDVKLKPMIDHVYSPGLKFKDIGSKVGLVETVLGGVFDQITNVNLFPHVFINERVIQRMKNVSDAAYKRRSGVKNDGIRQTLDVFNLLTLFCDLSQELEDTKFKDVIWLALMSMFAKLAGFVHSEEPLSLWPKLLRNSKAHGQVRLIGYMVSAFNVKDDLHQKSALRKNWEICIEVKRFVNFLSNVFEIVVVVQSKASFSKERMIRPVVSNDSEAMETFDEDCADPLSQDQHVTAT